MLIAKDTGIAGVPNIPQDGEGDGRPDVEVEAARCDDFPNKVDGGWDVEAEEQPHLRGLRALETQGESHPRSGDYIAGMKRRRWFRLEGSSLCSTCL